MIRLFRRATALTLAIGLTVCTALETAAFVPPSSYGASTDSVTAGPYDNGKMWAFEYPPIEHFRELYGLEASPEWFDHARLATLRLPNCTASFVSPSGLVMTNHHCVRASVAAVAEPGESLLDDGLVARTLAQERRVPGLYADQLVQIEEVTQEVVSAQEGGQTIAERTAAREEAIRTIQARRLAEVGGENAGYVVEVVSLYSGGRYSAYTFRRYDDVRLVMAPEILIGHFGGDADNFTYPRYALDMSFLRIYEGGEPLSTDHYFKWSEAGAQEGDPVFVVGNPGSTLRLETVAQLEFRRDYQDRQVLEFYRNRHAALRAAYEATGDDNVRAVLLQASNGEKAYAGRIRGLEDPSLIARRRDAERQFLREVKSDPALQQEYGGLVDEIAALQLEKEDFGRKYSVYLAMTPASEFTSETLKRALAAFEYLNLRDRGVGAEALAEAESAIRGIEDTPDALDRHLLEGRIDLMSRFLSGQATLESFAGDRTTAAIAQDIFENSVLSSSESAMTALDGGTLSSSDPAIRFVAAFWDDRADFISGWTGLAARQSELLSKRGRAQFDVYGLSIPPDATFSLRIADGVVKGYPFNGTIAPANTTFFGMFDHYYSYLGSELEGEWDLPDRWLERSGEIEMTTPVDLVSTNDIIGGNSGSPLLNSDLEIVGLVFDGNIESLPGAYIYRDDRARSVSVDSRGIIEALESVYQLDGIVNELRTGELVEASGASQ